MISTKKNNAVVLAIIIACSATLASSITLVKDHERANTFSLTESLKKKVTVDTKGMSEECIMQYSLDITAQNLRFTRFNNLKKGQANCVGYAKFCSSICNEGFKNNRIKYRAHTAVGFIKIGDINICNVLKSAMHNPEYRNFVKDHDFVEVTTDKWIYQFDPCLYDIIGISCMSKQARK